MKNIITLLTFVLGTFVSFSQDKFELLPTGYTASVTKEVPGKTHEELYSATLSWIISEHHGYNVYPSKHDYGKSITLEVEAPDLIAINSLGRHTYKGKYTVTIYFSEGQYTFMFKSLEQYNEPTGKWIFIDLNNKDLFNKKGELRSMNKYLPEIATHMNNVNMEIQSYMAM